MTAKVHNFIKIKSFFDFFFIFFLSFSHYKLAKIVQALLLHVLPQASYIWSLAILWIILPAALAIHSPRQSGLFLDKAAIQRHKKILCLFVLTVCIGLLLFILLGVTTYFHSVKYPVLFFIVTPMAEELIFRGWIYGKIQTYKKFSPVFITALLFGLSHLQYTNYMPTHFVIFQVMYACILGIFLGKIRQYSKSIYIGIGVHMFINCISVYF